VCGRQLRDLDLGEAVCNARFLILPWVKVMNLASKVLSLSPERVRADWLDTHAVEPVLLETFVEPVRFPAFHGHQPFRTLADPCGPGVVLYRNCVWQREEWDQHSRPVRGGGWAVLRSCTVAVPASSTNSPDSVSAGSTVARNRRNMT
jgi:hypothetical protein